MIVTLAFARKYDVVHAFYAFSKVKGGLAKKKSTIDKRTIYGLINSPYKSGFVVWLIKGCCVGAQHDDAATLVGIYIPRWSCARSSSLGVHWPVRPSLSISFFYFIFMIVPDGMALPRRLPRAPPSSCSRPMMSRALSSRRQKEMSRFRCVMAAQYVLFLTIKERPLTFLHH